MFQDANKALNKDSKIGSLYGYDVCVNVRESMVVELTQKLGKDFSLLDRNESAIFESEVKAELAMCREFWKEASRNHDFVKQLKEIFSCD